MYTVGVISDTHAERHGKGEIGGIPPVVLETLKGCNLIVHCGDIGDTEKVIPPLKAIAPLTVIKGNHDKKIKEKFPWSAQFQLDEWQFWVVHGHGGRVRKDPLSIIDFLKRPADVLIFGHIHRPLVYIDKNIILLNPGSTSGTNYTPYASFMTMIVNNKLLEVTIYYLNKKRDAVEGQSRTTICKAAK